MSVTVPTLLGDPGPSVATTDVDDALIAVLKQWYPTWLRIESNERNLPQALKAPDGAAYAAVLDSDEWLDHWAPAVLVTTSKTTGRPNRNQDGIYDATWAVAISVVVRGTVPSETRKRASLYEVALRRCLGHRNAVANAGGILHSVRWQSAGTAALPNSRQGRYLCAGMASFTAITDAALKDTAGPTAPVAPTDPLPTYVPEVPVTEVDTDQIVGISPEQTVGG